MSVFKKCEMLRVTNSGMYERFYHQWQNRIQKEYIAKGDLVLWYGDIDRDNIIEQICYHIKGNFYFFIYNKKCLEKVVKGEKNNVSI